MNQAQLEILNIAIVTAAACSLPGVFLILRKMAMMSDAISHTILLGIVIAFFITHDLNSPLLLIGAALMGLVTVFLVEFIQKVQKISEDSSIGLVFPLLFSIGVLLISRYAGDVHLDTDAVLLGELAFAPFDRLVVNNVDIGPKSLYVMACILSLNLGYIGLFYKELKLVTFDPILAGVLGISPAIVHYSLMTMVSVTAVGAFNAVGAILVVALMIGPPATAYFITEKLQHMILASVFFGILSAVTGYAASFWLDVSIAGSMATMTGLIFFTVIMTAPRKGIIAVIRRSCQQKYEFAGLALLIHLLTLEARKPGGGQGQADDLVNQLQWQASFFHRVLDRLVINQYAALQANEIRITAEGRSYVQQSKLYRQLSGYEV
ncbi:metal ABC transporter permease [uncultured Sporomusa sp.]|nr:metal ABC transporter permease [uncultured Sporomusa sp.]